MRSYVLAHWVLTLLTAPFTSQAMDYFFGTSPHQVVPLLSVYPITVAFSFVFSFPTFLFCIACSYFLSKFELHSLFLKFLFIAITVAGILITMAVIGGSMSKDVVLAYSTTAVVIGLLLTIKAPAGEVRGHGIVRSDT